VSYTKGRTQTLRRKFANKILGKRSEIRKENITGEERNNVVMGLIIHIVTRVIKGIRLRWLQLVARKERGNVVRKTKGVGG
jgi:hypothetical protein